jgi:NitT/TauT family transport system ATP-binding protein/sulfonate transport system ATP-binding protein
LKSLVKSVGRVKVKGISKIFSTPQGEILALDNINLELSSGEFVSILGPSGCGKSTLLLILAGLERPTRGEVFFDGEKVEGPHYKRGVVFQSHALFPWLTVEDNIRFGLDVRKVSVENGLIHGMIKLVGLEGFEKAYPKQLSGGMAQRTALARTLINEPDLLLLDEPFGALDAFTRMEMQKEVVRIWQEKFSTTIFVTHDIDEAIYVADKVVVMSPRPGRIKKIFPILLPRPRKRNHHDFIDIRQEIYDEFETATETSPRR